MQKVSPGLDLRTATPEEVGAAFRLGVIAALRLHKKAGVPAIVWDRKNDRIIAVPPEEIPDFPETTAEAQNPFPESLTG